MRPDAGRHYHMDDALGHGHAHGPGHGRDEPAPTSGPHDPAAESLSQALRAGFNVLRVLIVVLLVAYVLSGWFQVGPGEQGLIVRLGHLLENPSPPPDSPSPAVFGPGWHFALPDPLDEKVLISGQTFQLAIDTFCFARDAKDVARPLAEVLAVKDQLAPGSDGTMLTGDRNLSHGVWTIEYRVGNAEAFVRTIGERSEAAEQMLRRLAEHAIVRAVASRRVEEVTREAIDLVREDVRRRLSAELDGLRTGIVVVRVMSETIEPGRVRQAFLRVAEAENEREKSIREAQQERDRILAEAAGRREQYEPLLAAIEEYGVVGEDDPRRDALRKRIDVLLAQAGGNVQVRLRDAAARRDAIRERSRRERDEFEQLLAAYRQNPELTVTRLWSRMREAVLNVRQNEIFYVPFSQILEIYINRDPQRMLEAEREKYQRQLGVQQQPGP